jgi:hypothetical protein
MITFIAVFQKQSADASQCVENERSAQSQTRREIFANHEKARCPEIDLIHFHSKPHSRHLNAEFDTTIM